MKNLRESYIEVLLNRDDIDTWNLIPGSAEKFHIGDKIILDRNRINEPDFMIGTFTDSLRNSFHSREKRYFTGTSNRCFIQITEKIYHEFYIELHGKVVLEDGKFYSKSSTTESVTLPTDST